ncbi:Hypothetical predicted protein [Paramuricea clavata]|uniref:Uncharacterized protein n=1 Tax=Paramuricea clavata TaxID=317549 RepID=A0A6S7FX39_PARCT|nr:Hypothetical predicted protein [Paramuricea clavata]
MYVTAKEKYYLISYGDSDDDPVRSEVVSIFQSNHEEADTRLLLHAKHAAATYDRIIIKSPDTDVFILSIAMQPAFPKELYMMAGTGNSLCFAAYKCQRYPITWHSQDVTAQALFMEKERKQLGKHLDFPPGEELINGLNKFTCRLYGDKESTTVDNFDNGWNLANGELAIVWMTHPSAPQYRCLSVLIADARQDASQCAVPAEKRT